MRKADVFRAMFSSLFTLHMETPEQYRDAALQEYIDKYMPNFGKVLPPKDNTVMIKFRKYLDNKCKEDVVDDEEAFKITKQYIKETTAFSDVINQVTLQDWRNLCELIDVSNEVNAVNAMKEAGTYKEMMQSGSTGDDITEYIRNHPELLEKANPDMAAQAMSTMAGLNAMGTMGMGMSAPAKKQTIHPNQKKKKK
ncbi:MAG: hypothetical protein IKV96_01640, partial [Firmicutes bacterium]|nr:hypothetical protein [Bacillota bacterium]